MKSKLLSIYTSSAPPMPAALWVSVYLRPMKESIGADDCFEELICQIDDRNGNWFMSEADIKRISSLVLKTLRERPGLVEHCREHYLKHIQQAFALLNHADLAAYLEGLSVSDRVKLFTDIAQNYFTASYYVEPPNFSLELGGQDLIKSELRHWFRDQEIELKPSAFDEYFATVATYTDITFTQRAELALLRIAKAEGEQRELLIRQYVQEFYWRYYDYFGLIVDEASVKEELRGYASLSVEEIDARIQKIETGIREQVIAQKDALSRYPLPESLRDGLRILREFGFLYSDIKKEQTSRVNVKIGEFLAWLASKHKLTEAELHYATFGEIVELLQGESMDTTLFAQRMQKSVLACTADGSYYRFLSLPEVEEVEARKRVEDHSAMQHLKGTAACSGIYRGTVKVLASEKEIEKVQQGDILVTTMTTVNFVPAMKKAGAIITDLGGITCHAAIVSRELGTPCIIGTKVATKVLRDGDEVEVDANHGIVAKLNNEIMK